MSLISSTFSQLPKLLREFIIYGICGVGSLIIFSLCAEGCEWIYPAFVSEELPNDIRARNLLVYQIIAFFPANVWSWWSNRTFVFQGRKHSAWQELGLVFLIAAIAFVLSFGISTWLVARHGIPNSLAHFTLAIVSAIWNFLLRRFFVFGSTPALK